MTTSNEYMVDTIIACHPHKDLIRKIQRLAYKGKSRLHKEGVDALCLLTGPFGGALFDVFDQHRDNDRVACEDLVNYQLLPKLQHTNDNRTLIIHLLNTHPGRISSVKEMMTNWLNQPM